MMDRALRIVIASHDFRFVEGIRADLASQPSVEVRIDRWTGSRPGGHDEAASLELLAWADVILCEWCLANAVWYSARKRPGQRLIVRFHRFELETDMPPLVEIDAVDTMVFVADHVMAAARKRFGWHAGMRVVGNAVDTHALDLPKLPAAATTLGLLGWVPKLKRLDRALDILEAVRAHDDRFRLVVKGKAPWEHAWVWRDEVERWYPGDVLARIERTPQLRNAVVIEGFGPVAQWFRGVGHILSTSDLEGNQVAVAEGAASGAVPCILQRPGATQLYPAWWVHDDVDAAAAAILAPGWTDRVAAAKRDAAERFAATRIMPVWRELVSERHLERSQK